MRDFRVLITHNCNANCTTCFNKSIRHGAEMSLEDFYRIADYLSEAGIEKIKIMGGEPTVHPQFSEIMRYAQERFQSVHLFTNALNDGIFSFCPRKRDSIIYNLNCMKQPIETKKLLLDRRGGRMFETQLSSGFSGERIKELLREISDIVPSDQMGIALTLDCTENIFVNKEKIISLWNEIDNFVHSELGIQYHIDHNIPFCFFCGSGMNIRTNKSLCSVNCSGLITPDLKLQYCNQSSEVLCDLVVDARLIPFEIVLNRLNGFYYKKMSKNLDKLCSDCLFFNNKCNGGCFLHKEHISRDDIVLHTSLPIRS